MWKDNYKRLDVRIREFLKSIEGLSANTKRVYEQSLWQLQSRIKGDEPTPDEILSFLKSYQISSLHRHKAAIKAYLEFKGEGWPFTRRQFQSRRRHIPRYVTTDVVEEIAKTTQNEDDYMFVTTLFTLGCRISELMGIRGEDITPAGVRLLTKGGSQHLKPITRDFYQVLSKYAGKRSKVFPESYSYYYLRLKGLATGIGHPEVTPHILRHARAVDLLRKGMSLPFVQQFLGHASINTTAIYLEITGGELAKELEKVER